MENFTDLIKTLQSGSLTSFSQLTNKGFKLYYLALGEEFYYVEIIKNSIKDIKCHYGRLYLDETKNLKYEDTPIQIYDISFDEYVDFKYKAEKIDRWDSTLIKTVCQNYSFLPANRYK